MDRFVRVRLLLWDEILPPVSESEIGLSGILLELFLPEFKLAPSRLEPLKDESLLLPPQEEDDQGRGDDRGQQRLDVRVIEEGDEVCHPPVTKSLNVKTRKPMTPIPSQRRSWVKAETRIPPTRR